MATIQLEEMSVSGDPGARIDDEEERRRERERLAAEQREAEEREARREALRDMSGFPEAGTSARVMEDVERDQGRTRQVGNEPGRGVILSGSTRGSAPMRPEAAERMAAVESRLQAGDRAGVEQDTRREQQGLSAPSDESLSAPQPASPMQRDAVTAARPVPMRQEPIGTGGDPGIRARTSALLDDSRGSMTQEPVRVRRPEGFQGPQGGTAFVTPEASPVRKPEAAPDDAPRGRLDDGLPSEADIGSARDVDTFRRILHAIGNGLLGYSGRAPQQFRSNADALQQRRDAGLQQRMGQKRQDVQQQDAMGLRTAQMDAQREDRAAARQVQDSQLDIQRRRVDLSERALESEQAESTRTREADAQLDLVDSSASQRERAALAVRLSQISPEQRREALAQIGGSEGLTGLTGREAAALRGELARPVQPRGTALRGPGMARGQRDESIESLRSAAREAGIPDAVASSATPAELRRELIARSRPRAGSGRGGPTTEVGEEILPGVRAGIDLSAGEARAIRNSFADLRSQMGALGEIERVAGTYGASAAIDRRAAGELAAPVASLRAMVAQLQNTGVINPSEAPAIEAMLPNPQSMTQMTFGDLTSRLRSFRGALERAVDGRLLARGVDDEGRAEAIRMLRGGGRGSARQAPQQRRQQDASGNVVMYGPDGPRRVPPEMVEQREAMGWTYEPGAR